MDPSTRLQHLISADRVFLAYAFSDAHEATDTLAEWLRRRPAKPMGSSRVGSNPTGVDFVPPESLPDRRRY